MLRYLIVINCRWTLWNSSSSIQRNTIWLWKERFRTLWCTWYHSYIYVCVPVSKLDTLLRANCAEHANILLLEPNKIILPPETEPNINRYTLSNTWIKTPRSDGLWNYNEIIYIDKNNNLSANTYRYCMEFSYSTIMYFFIILFGCYWI